MTTKEKAVLIRWMIRSDMDEVAAIENDVFEFPWCYDDFVRCLRERNCIGMVAERDKTIVGFMVYELFTKKLRILNFAVRRDHWRLGVGRAMIAKLRGKLPPRGRRTKICLEIRDRNLPAQQFFRAMGFKATGIMRNFYIDTDEDAYAFEFRA